MPGMILRIVMSGLLRLVRKHSVAWKPYPRQLAIIASLILRWMQAVHIASGTTLHVWLRIVFLLLIIALSFLLPSHLVPRLARPVALSRHKHHLPSRLHLPVQTITIIPSISCSTHLILCLHLSTRVSSSHQLPRVLRWLRDQVHRGPRQNLDQLCRQKPTMRSLFCYGIMLKRQVNGKCCLFSRYLKYEGRGFNP